MDDAFSLKRQAERMAAGIAALATSGLSGCNDNGAVDPPPPPFSCDLVDEGETLRASATVEGTRLDVSVEQPGSSSWRSVSVSDVQGATLVSLRVSGGKVDVVMELEALGTSQGSFTFEGELHVPSANLTCGVRRSFRFTISDGTVEISLVSERLPLAAGDRAEILLVAREGRRVEVRGRTPYREPRAFAWAVSAGRVLVSEGDRLVWEVPPEPGFYQVELVVDYGDDGLA
ncbi:MAG: hypothetical protein ACE5HP_04765, partial [Gemmatimonadota bacterium]